jgi:membrane protein
MEAMNVMYEVEEDRPFWKVYGLSIFMSLAVIILMLSAFGIVIFGGSVGGGLAGVIGLGNVFETAWSIVQWPIVACIVLFTFALIYFFAPAAKQRFHLDQPRRRTGLRLLVALLAALLILRRQFRVVQRELRLAGGRHHLMLYIYYSSLSCC